MASEALGRVGHIFKVIETERQSSSGLSRKDFFPFFFSPPSHQEGKNIVGVDDKQLIDRERFHFCTKRQNGHRGRREREGTGEIKQCFLLPLRKLKLLLFLVTSSREGMYPQIEGTQPRLAKPNN